MMPGEVARIVKTADGCCDKYELVCKPETCTIHLLTCTPPQLMKNINPGECCPTFQCECPAVCPTAVKPTCQVGKVAVPVDTTCNCTSYTCVSRVPLDYGPAVCWYKHSNGSSLSYKVNETWTDGVCKSCECEKRLGGNGEVCHRERQCVNGVGGDGQWGELLNLSSGEHYTREIIESECLGGEALSLERVYKPSIDGYFTRQKEL
ncbi:von Willebrand factor-like [Saccostrea cucullata]|uniref:von Willebrand factor-like n=1 Tax=Saccostrea cuccullata TaxID=36930 RepID=UPI002ED0F8D5